MQNPTKFKNNRVTSAYSSNVISLLFTLLWGRCRHRDDNPCWDSVASSRQIWMLNPLAKHHSQSELAMINNPTREIWLGGMEAGDLREWVTAMSLLSGLSQIENHTPRKHEMFIWLMSDVFCKHGCVVTQKLGLWHGAIKWKLSCECVSQLQAGRVHAYAHLFFSTYCIHICFTFRKKLNADSHSATTWLEFKLHVRVWISWWI